MVEIECWKTKLWKLNWFGIFIGSLWHTSWSDWSISTLFTIVFHGVTWPPTLFEKFYSQNDWYLFLIGNITKQNTQNHDLLLARDLYYWGLGHFAHLWHSTTCLNKSVWKIKNTIKIPHLTFQLPFLALNPRDRDTISVDYLQMQLDFNLSSDGD